jgi:hypothetical protein
MKRWDDLQILRHMDEVAESNPSALMHGLQLLQSSQPPGEWDHLRDPPAFAKELLLARDAGLVTWEERDYGQELSNPASNSYQWLQQIRDLSLTIGPTPFTISTLGRIRSSRALKMYSPRSRPRACSGRRSSAERRVP